MWPLDWEDLTTYFAPETNYDAEPGFWGMPNSYIHFLIDKLCSFRLRSCACVATGDGSLSDEVGQRRRGCVYWKLSWIEMTQSPNTNTWRARAVRGPRVYGFGGQLGERGKENTWAIWVRSSPPPPHVEAAPVPWVMTPKVVVRCIAASRSRHQTSVMKCRTLREQRRICTVVTIRS